MLLVSDEENDSEVISANTVQEPKVTDSIIISHFEKIQTALKEDEKPAEQEKGVLD
jgi:hypothetical protein